MIRRIGNFGIVDDGAGNLCTFNLNARAATGGWAPTSYMLRGGHGGGRNYVTINGVDVIPYGEDNDLPGYVSQILNKFYAGEGIMGKKVGLQWGEGPRLYYDAVDKERNLFYRQWVVNPEADAALRRADWTTQMLRCLVDLMHLEGFWVKITRTRGARIGDPKIARIEHVPASKVRFVYPGNDDAEPTQACVGDFPNPDPRYQYVYPLFNPADPTKHAVSMAYFSIYTFRRNHYSLPRYVGAFDWIELAGTLASILAAYNENASAISLHIESPQSYWDELEAKLKEYCEQTGQIYTAKMLEQKKDEAMEAFSAQVTGKENVGKFLHTSSFWSNYANSFEGWKITPIDKKIKDYIEAQVTICRKAEAAATSGFGLDPALSNLILDTKLGSGSEKLYSLKVYNATETAIPDMVLCAPWQYFLDVNFPDWALRVGMYRTVVDAEKNINPENRVKANA